MYAKSYYNSIIELKVIIRFPYSIVTITTGNITLKKRDSGYYSEDEYKRSVCG